MSGDSWFGGIVLVILIIAIIKLFVTIQPTIISSYRRILRNFT